MQRLKKIPFFLILLVVFFCLHGSVENYGYLNVSEVLWLAGKIFIGIAILFSILLLFTKNYIFSSLVTFFISIWYLFFGAMHDWIKSMYWLSFMRSYTVLVPLLIILTIVWIIWLKRNKPVQPKLVLYFNLLLILFCVSDTVMLVIKKDRFKKTSEDRVAFNFSQVQHKPNVYFLLFDEYAGYKSLKDSFSFANDSLYNFMQQQGFNVLPLHANYEYTPFSMSSILNMQYVDSNYDHRLLTQKDVQQRFGEIRNAEVFSIFKTMGYNIENYSIFDIKDHPALSGANPLFPIHTHLLTDKIFHNRLIKDIGWRLVEGRFAISFLKKYYLYPTDDYNKDVEQKIISSAGKTSARPKFCYAHFMLPHGPYFRDSAGNYNQPSQMRDLFNKPLYLSYLKYSNTIIMRLVKNMIAADPNAIVIVMSDHGFYSYANAGDDDPYNYDNFCLVRFPDKNYIPYKEKWSNVNFFRYLFNCEFGQKLPYLKDSTIFVNE